jgi:SAM-dependent methyltransferase
MGSLKSSHFIPRSRLVHKTAPAVDFAIGRKVLHVGLGTYIDDPERAKRELSDPDTDQLHPQLARVASSLTGSDGNAQAIEIMQRVVPGDYVLADHMSPDFVAAFGGERFELIVFANEIERLDNFGVAIRNLKELLSPGGRMMVLTINAYNADAFAKMLFRYESGHDDHTCYFSYMTLGHTLAMNGLKVDEFMFYTHKRLAHFNSWRHYVGHYLGNWFRMAFPQFAEGIIAVATAT